MIALGAALLIIALIAHQAGRERMAILVGGLGVALMAIQAVFRPRWGGSHYFRFFDRQ